MNCLQLPYHHMCVCEGVCVAVHSMHVLATFFSTLYYGSEKIFVHVHVQLQM